MEQYHIHHYTDCKPRNRCEKELLDWVKNYLKDPIDLDIENVRAVVAHQAYSGYPASYGSVTVTDIRISTRYMGTSHVERLFAITGRGRKTASMLIEETTPKDASNGFKPVDL